MPDDPFLFPLLFLGDKAEKAVALGNRTLTFTMDPAYGKPCARVTERDGKAMLKRSPELFAWAPEAGPVVPSVAELERRIEELEARVIDLEMNGRARKARKAEAE